MRHRLTPTIVRRRALAAFAGLALMAAVTACGSGGGGSSPPRKEVNPAGDIPDSQVYVRYSPPGAGFSVKVPEGWSRTRTGGAVTFTDKLNSIRLQSVPAGTALSAAAARAEEVPGLSRTVPGFSGVRVSTVRRDAGGAVRIAYLARAKADPVTGRAGIDAVERYTFFHAGRRAVLTLSGPRGADNVDPWRIVTGSLRWSP